jgi:hypothetical protein
MSLSTLEVIAIIAERIDVFPRPSLVFQGPELACCVGKQEPGSGRIPPAAVA